MEADTCLLYSAIKICDHAFIPICMQTPIVQLDSHNMHASSPYYLHTHGPAHKTEKTPATTHSATYDPSQVFDKMPEPGRAMNLPLAAELVVALELASVVCVDSCTDPPVPGSALPVAVAMEVGTAELLLVEDAALSPYPIVGSWASALTCQALVVNSGHTGAEREGL